MQKYNVVHVETGKSIIIEHEGFKRNKLLTESSKKLGTDFNSKLYGQYKIQPV
tara:strand:+ start:128 stop:286 length:159 start_codon:yes stop_codon:yes gene_type:complete